MFGRKIILKTAITSQEFKVGRRSGFHNMSNTNFMLELSDGTTCTKASWCYALLPVPLRADFVVTFLGVARNVVRFATIMLLFESVVRNFPAHSDEELRSTKV